MIGTLAAAFHLAMMPRLPHKGGFGASGPAVGSYAATLATLQQNNKCLVTTLGEDYYFEIDTPSGTPLFTYAAGGGTVQATTKMSVASASKMIASAYVVQYRGGNSSLTSNDIASLHQADAGGYTNGSDKCNGTQNVLACMQIVQSPGANCAGAYNASGLASLASSSPLYGWGCPANQNVFSYSGSHFMMQALLYMPSSYSQSANTGVLTATVNAALGINILYTTPLLPGGIYTNAAGYLQFLQRVAGGQLAYQGSLGTSTICTLPGADYSNQTLKNSSGGSAGPGPSNCPSTFTPLGGYAEQYSIGHWVESDPATHGDGAFSSAGAYGFYPFIAADQSFVGVLARYDTSGQQGKRSLACGALARRAWVTGIQQTGTIPTN